MQSSTSQRRPRLAFNPMNFISPKDLGIKAAGGDDSYSAAVNQDFAPLTLGS
jgi:hypothetical protein